MDRSFRSQLTLLDAAAGLGIFSFFASVYCISHRPDDYRKAQRFYVIYGGVLLALTTIDLVSGALWGQYMWIDHRNFPGGPLGYFIVSEAAWYNVLGMAAGATANILGDGLLVRPMFLRGAAEMVGTKRD
jgi:hypothetical protein